jgi:hypothetical protein
MGIMNEQDLELFKKHFHLYECYKKHAFIRNYDKDVYNDLIHLYTTYVNEKHLFSHWCSSCRVELVNYLYGWFTNETHTTWYKQEVPVTEEVPFTTEENVIENTSIKKRRRKTN